MLYPTRLIKYKKCKKCIKLLILKHFFILTGARRPLLITLFVLTSRAAERLSLVVYDLILPANWNKGLARMAMSEGWDYHLHTRILTTPENQFPEMKGRSMLRWEFIKENKKTKTRPRK